jgi:hypothetical protein
MARPKKTEAPFVQNIPPGSNEPGEVPTIRWLSMVKTKGGYAVLSASTAGREIQSVEVLHGPLDRTAASAALRTEMARAYLLGKGPQ